MAKKHETPMRPAQDEAAKEQVYEMIQRAVALKTGRRIDRLTAKGILDAAIEMLFTAAVQNGYVRLPRAFGSLHLRELQPTRKRTPQGEIVDIPQKRHILKYVEGLAVREMLGKPDKYDARSKPRESAVSELFEKLEEAS